MNDLLPCPFCGAPGYVSNDSGRHYPGCSDCDCIAFDLLTSFARRTDAIAAWNRRTPHDRRNEQ